MVSFIYLLFSANWDYLAAKADQRIIANKNTLNRGTELLPDHEPIDIQ